MNVSFYIRGVKIYGLITWGNKIYRYSTGLKIEAKKWENSRVNPRYSESTHINGLLAQYKKTIETAYYSQVLSGKEVSKEFFEVILKHKNTKSLYEALDEMINDEPGRKG
jgi:hypothetical protein